MLKKAPRVAPLLFALPLSIATAIAAAAAPAGAPVAPVAPVAPGATQPAARQFSEQDEIQARIMLGEQFCDLALALAHSARMSPASMRQSAVLLEAAMRMNPYEPRYPRLLAEPLTRLNDVDGAIGAWGAYRKLAPDDRVAQVQLIDLYSSRLQTNDAKIKYAKELLANPKLAPEVKAHIAVNTVPLLNERSQEEAQAMVRQAREYYPLPDVTLLALHALPPDATPEMRLPLLLDVLRANPLRGDAIAEVADLLSATGLSEQAIVWYDILLRVNAVQGTAPPANAIINLMAEKYRTGDTTLMNGENKTPAEVLDDILQRYPEDIDAWLLRLTIQRNDESAQMLTKARTAFVARLNGVSDQVLKAAAAAATQPSAAPAAPAGADTQPGVAATQPSPDAPPANEFAPKMPDAVRRALASRDPAMRNTMVAALADLAWFELYFGHRADAASQWIDALRLLVPADDLLLARLQGWQHVVAGRTKEARAALAPLAERDPLSALGLFVLANQEKQDAQVEAIGRTLVSTPRSGVLGAILWQATKGRGLKATTRPAGADVVRAELEKFPTDFLEIVRTPNKFYSMRADAIRVGHKLGEPMFANVTITNVGKQDLTIGEYGVIKPYLFFDAQIRGANPRVYSGTAVEQIMGRSVLRPGESVNQLVRIDQGELSDALHQKPAMTMMVAADVVSNPRQVEGMVRAQPGGYAANFNRMFTRSPALTRNDKERRKFLADITGNQTGPAEKILGIETLAAFIHESAQPDATPAIVTQAQQYKDTLEKERTDPMPGVKIWANYSTAILTTGIEGQRVLDEMATSNSWESRLMSLVAGRFFAPDSQRGLATKLSADTDVLVRNYAVSMLQILQEQQPAATQPAATQPSATQPTTTQPTATQPATISLRDKATPVRLTPDAQPTRSTTQPAAAE